MLQDEAFFVTVLPFVESNMVNAECLKFPYYTDIIDCAGIHPLGTGYNRW